MRKGDREKEKKEIYSEREGERNRKERERASVKNRIKPAEVFSYEIPDGKDTSEVVKVSPQCVFTSEREFSVDKQKM